MGNTHVVTNTKFRLNKPHEVINVSKKLTCKLIFLQSGEGLHVGGVSLQTNSAVMDPLVLLAKWLPFFCCCFCFLKTYCNGLQKVQWAWLLPFLICGKISTGSFNQRLFSARGLVKCGWSGILRQIDTLRGHASRRSQWEVRGYLQDFSMLNFHEAICPKNFQTPKLEIPDMYQDSHGPNH